ncbi:MAG: S9 family peptidase, partial [Rhodobiaceae bacterium]|nr:S9 family peptidase [Rhodobiaceae bacterium]
MSSIKKDSPPCAEKIPVSSNQHGYKLVDPYDWIRDDNWQEVLHSPNVLKKEIRDYIDKENEWTDRKLSNLSPLKEVIYNEIKGRMKEEDISLPQKDGPWFYFSETKKGKEYSILKRYKTNTSIEEGVIFHNWNDESKGFDYFKPGVASCSPNHNLLSWSFDSKGSEFFSIKIKDLKNNKIFYDQVNNTDGNMVWSLDGSGFYFIKMDKNHRPSSLWFHNIGTEENEDYEIYNEKDTGYFLSISETLNKKFLILSIHNHETSEVRIIDQRKENKELILFTKRQKGIEYSIEHDQENSEFLILTNINDATDYKIMKTDENALDKKNWYEFISHKKDILITDFSCLENFIIVQELENGIPRILSINKQNNKQNIIKFDEEVYDLDFNEGNEYSSNTIQIYYSSMTTPQVVYEYNLVEKKKIVLKKQEIPSGHNPKNYITKRIFAKSKDGEKIPISILKRNSTLENSPTLLYGYGSYGISIPPSFSASRLSLVDRGMVYAIAHIRGGMDKGKKWYKDGKKEKKINSFEDFISSALFLKKEKISSDISIQGGSAGGLLVGASLNMRPDIFKSAVAEVPFVDVLNTILDDSLPLTPPEWEEWGNPIKNKNDFDYISSYS